MSDQPWNPERHVAALEAEISRLLSIVGTADPGVPVPTCPGWTIAKLTRHCGMLYRWVDHLVREKVQEELWSSRLGIAAPGEGLPQWTSAGADHMLATLRSADPDAPVWSWGADQHVRFWSRRMLFETVIHRADAELALGHRPVIDTAMALDGIDELLANLSHAVWVAENLRALGDRAGQTLHLHATDPGAQAGEWMITLDDAGYGWEHGHGKGTVAVRAPAADLLLLTYGRIPQADDALTVFGDTDLLAHWLEKSAL